MTTATISATRPSRLRALAVLIRAAAGLLVHGLRHPFAPAAIDRRTGKVVPR